MQHKQELQQLNQTEKKVWNTVEKYTKQIMTGEVEGFLKYFHKDYLGWNYIEQMPVSKSEIKNELQDLPKLKICSYSLTPVSIQIKNDVAIVHYFYSVIFVDHEGNEKSKTARNTDILVKENNKWVLIGDHVDQMDVKINTIQNLNLWENL